MMESYEKKIDAQLKEWDAKIDLLKAEIQEKEADAELESEIEDLKRKREALSQKLSEMKTKGRDAFGLMEESLKQAIQDLEDGLVQAKNKLQE